MARNLISQSIGNLASLAPRSFSTQTQNAPENFADMTNSELEDTSTIPGWDLIHSPPRKFPRGALIGKVVSDKMNKTVNVAVDRFKIVPKIRKRIKYTRKFMAHDEDEVSAVGDLVLITPCHRLSKHKHFMLREFLRPLTSCTRSLDKKRTNLNYVVLNS